jgi:hypothetical protein
LDRHGCGGGIREHGKEWVDVSGQFAVDPFYSSILQGPPDFAPSSDLVLHEIETDAGSDCGVAMCLTA